MRNAVVSEELERQTVSNKTEVQNLEHEVLSSAGQKVVLARLARVSGHLQAIKKMVEAERDIEATLVQILAVLSALRSVERVMLTELMEQKFGDVSSESRAVDYAEMLKTVERYFK